MKKLHALDYYIIFCLFVLVSYTIVNLYLFKDTMSEPSTLTTCVFGAFGGEFLTCGLIKIFKIREGSRHAELNDLPEELSDDGDRYEGRKPDEEGKEEANG